MKEENKKYWIVAALVIVVLAWYFWEKIEAMIDKAKAATVVAGTSSGTASTVAQSATASSAPAKSAVKFYPYGNGGFVEDTALLNFTPKTGTKSAFK